MFKLILLIFTIVGFLTGLNEGALDESQSQCQPSNGYFRAATFEHQRIDLASVKDSVNENLDIYARVAKIAAENDAQIIVFPEDGLMDGPPLRLRKVVEDIPDPMTLDSNKNNPCSNPKLFPGLDILIKLSCIAKENNLYLVANYGTREACNTTNYKLCPETGDLLLNTNVVFDNDGRFIRRYRKWNLFVESFDRAKEIENVYFDTPYGRFGLSICFDMMFKRPAIDLVEKYKIDTMLFPTWWYDEFPMLTATQFQDAWSLYNRVNLVASNVHKRELGSVGSGIYSTNGKFITTSPSDNEPKLLLANLPIKNHLHSNDELSQCIDFKPQKIEFKSKQQSPAYQHSNYKLYKSDLVYPLEKSEDKYTACQNEVCCTVDYKILQRHPASVSGSLVLIIRDSLRGGTFRWYEQVCLVASVQANPDQSSESLKNTKYLSSPIASFERLSINATFNTPYVYPIAAHHSDLLVDRKDHSHRCDNLDIYLGNQMFECRHSFEPKNHPELLTLGMYSRVYERDQVNYNEKIVKFWTLNENDVLVK